MSAPTAPLPPDAAKALAKLERAFIPVPLNVVRAVARYEAASARYDELIARPATTWSPAELTAFGAAQQTIAEALDELGKAGRLDLIAPAEVATRYRQAAAHCRQLAEAADYEGCLDAQDEMTACRCKLAEAGRLDLIGGA